ncbi:response regulator [Alkalinema pantanalense CENA528]|uniref:response regulator n=1 Tax=Alkalinema pantanalense TaxID=1620705 RepID=UPI003D6E0E80
MKRSDPILLVEDDRIDVLNVKRGLREIQATNPLYVVEDGEEALEFLRNAQNPKPALILLDLNMPRMNGLELLQVLKGDPVLKMIPVIILTTSQEEKDRQESFRLSVAGYMVKPLDYENFLEILQAIYQYWLLSQSPNEMSS